MYICRKPAGCVNPLKAKKIVAIMPPSLSITEKRQEEIAFTDKLYAADRPVVAKNSDIQPTVESLKGKRVGVLQGTTQETFGYTGHQKALKSSRIRGRTTFIPTLLPDVLMPRSRMRSLPVKVSSNNPLVKITNSVARLLKMKNCLA